MNSFEGNTQVEIINQQNFRYYIKRKELECQH